MSDIKPPRSSGDDREVLLTLLRYQREAADRSPVRSGTTLLWLIRHLAYAERGSRARHRHNRLRTGRVSADVDRCRRRDLCRNHPR